MRLKVMTTQFCLALMHIFTKVLTWSIPCLHRTICGIVAYSEIVYRLPDNLSI
jgi:hypothetical protein